MTRSRHLNAASSPLNLAPLREKQGISLDQIANNTKISKRFLLAIEAEAFDQLPGGIFSTSYIRQYARAVGYDESALLDAYRSAMGLDGETSAMHPAGPEAGKRTSLKWQRSPVVL